MSRRTDRVGDLLRSELSGLILNRVSDPRAKLTTVSEVRVSPDLRHAVVYLSVLGDEDSRAESLAAMRHARGFLRAELAKSLRHLRVTPELDFRLDRGAEYSQRISDLLENLDEHDESA